MPGTENSKRIVLFVISAPQIPMINRNKNEVTLVDIRTLGIFCG